MKLFGQLAAAVAILGAAYMVRSSFTKTMASVVSGRDLSCLEMQGSTYREDEGATYIVGTVKNSCDRRYGNVTVLFKLDLPSFGGTGDVREGVGYAYVRDLKSGETREFKSAVPIPKDASYRFDRINAY